MAQGFALRWLLAVAVALSVTSAAEYAVATSQLKTRLLAQYADQYQVRSEQILTAWEEADEGEDPADEAREVLRITAADYGVHSANLVSVDGSVLAAEGDLGHDDAAVVHTVADVRLSAGEVETVPLLEDASAGSGEHYLFLAGLDLPAGSYVFAVDVDAAVLNDVLHDLRLRRVMTLALMILFAVPLSYVLGGRNLRRRHQRAVAVASRDSLTGLAQHGAFSTALDGRVAWTAAEGQTLTVALLDVDHFKQVNDRLGHRFGDRVLTDLTRSLEDRREGDLSYRIGGDEFALLLPGVSATDAHGVISRMIENFSRSQPDVTLSVGTATTSGDEALSSEELWERADAALYEAKRRGRAQIVSFGEFAPAPGVSGPDEVKALARVLATGSVRVAFQPIFGLGHQQIVGFEALCRIPTGGPLRHPGHAFEVAERAGLAAELDAAVRAVALEAATGLPPGTSLFLNVHPATFSHPLMATERLLAEVAEVGIAPNQVVFEFSEQTSKDATVIAQHVERLRRAGFRTALDDVGAGNVGLHVLRHARFDILKVDREVTVSAASDVGAAAVLDATLAYAAARGIDVILEGVESPVVLDFVRATTGRTVDLRVQAVQGFALGHPQVLEQGQALSSVVDDLSFLRVPEHEHRITGMEALTTTVRS